MAKRSKATTQMEKFIEEVWGKKNGLTFKEMTYFIALSCKEVPRRAIDKVTRLVLKTGLQKGVFTHSAGRYSIPKRHRRRFLGGLAPKWKRSVSRKTTTRNYTLPNNKRKSVRSRKGHASLMQRAGASGLAGFSNLPGDNNKRRSVRSRQGHAPLMQCAGASGSAGHSNVQDDDMRMRGVQGHAPTSRHAPRPRGPRSPRLPRPRPRNSLPRWPAYNPKNPDFMPEPYL